MARIRLGEFSFTRRDISLLVEELGLSGRVRYFRTGEGDYNILSSFFNDLIGRKHFYISKDRKEIFTDYQSFDIIDYFIRNRLEVTQEKMNELKGNKPGKIKRRYRKYSQKIGLKVPKPVFSS